MFFRVKTNLEIQAGRKLTSLPKQYKLLEKNAACFHPKAQGGAIIIEMKSFQFCSCPSLTLLF